MNKGKRKVSVVIVTRNRKKDLLECIRSYTNSTYKNLEIIVMDNGSTDGSVRAVRQKYPKVTLVDLDTNVGAAKGRNVGLEKASGEYILFTDDDASCDKNMVQHLVDAFTTYPKAGIIQPLVYDKQNKNLLQGAGHDIDLLTGRIKAWGVKEKDQGQYEGIREVPMCGCVWMVKREVFERIGNYDEDYFIPYEDSDFSLRARKAGFKLFCASEAKTYHRGHKSTFIHPWIEWLGITSAERAYRVARNKIIFMAKHAEFKNLLFFLFFMLPFYLVSQSIIILLTGRLDILKGYLLGVLSGLDFILSIKMNVWLLSWSEPIGWIIIPNPKSILDLGCGPGKIMTMIKHRTRIGKAVGIDMYKPFIDKCKIEGQFDRLILSDIRKISFRSKSFDVAVANQVIEHLGKKDALLLVKKMEEIARKQVIISTPIGQIEDPCLDGNKYQKHQSAFAPEDFERMGYRIVKYGYRWLLGPKGLSDTTTVALRKFYYILNFLLTPLYYFWQDSCDYFFVASKKLDKID